MPPEYVDSGFVSKKCDVFSLGVIIIKLMDGHLGRTRSSQMGTEQFIQHVRKIMRNIIDIFRIILYMYSCLMFNFLTLCMMIKQVCENWKKKLQMPRHPYEEIESRQVKKCVEVALRCVEHDRNKRPSLKDVVDELEQLEAEIKKLLLPSVESKDLIVQVLSF